MIAPRPILALLLTALYGAGALFFAVLAAGAPCGFAPGLWCDEQKPGWFAMTLQSLGFDGIIIAAAGLYPLMALLYVACFRFARARKSS